jgi:hypothetical protein
MHNAISADAIKETTVAAPDPIHDEIKIDVPLNFDFVFIKPIPSPLLTLYYSDKNNKIPGTDHKSAPGI